jgi:hypothetical protein
MPRAEAGARLGLGLAPASDMPGEEDSLDDVDKDMSSPQYSDVQPPERPWEVADERVGFLQHWLWEATLRGVAAATMATGEVVRVALRMVRETFPFVDGLADAGRAAVEYYRQF